MDLNNQTTTKVVVVEGYHDLARIKSIYPDIDIVITNGSEISEDTLRELTILNQERGLILFLDPDVPGERIRRIINDRVGVTAHAFLPKEKCISKSKKKIGIEHANKEDIIEALSSFKMTVNNSNKSITIQDLYDLNLIGKKDSKQRRIQLTKQLGIGLANGKTLLHKLQMFQLTKEDIIKHL
jgi:ribonuclease M5